MKKTLLAGLAVGVMMFGMTGVATATMATMDFTGGTFSGTWTPGAGYNGTTLGSWGASLTDDGLTMTNFNNGTHVGNYYGTLGDVAHIHDGYLNFDLGGTLFDLIQFDLTSNMSGAHLEASNGLTVALPLDDWGGTAVTITPNLTDLSWFRIHSEGFCVGVDNIAYNATPTPVPGAIWLLGAGLVGLVGARRKNA